MIEYDVPKIASKLRVEGDMLMLLQIPPAPLPQEFVVVKAHTVTYSPETPFYDGLEGWCQWVGDAVRVAPAVLSIQDRILYIYDYRPAFYPKVLDIADQTKRMLELNAVNDDPELYGPNGEMREWQAGGNYGYAWNLDTDYFSEWGYAPFPHAGESEDEMIARGREGLENFAKAMGTTLDELTVIDGAHVVAADYATE